MNKAEAILALKNGDKIKHKYFLSHEWITMENGVILTEDGFPCDEKDWWAVRSSEHYEDGWSIFKEKDTKITIGQYKKALDTVRLYELQQGAEFLEKNQTVGAFIDWTTKHYTGRYKTVRLLNLMYHLRSNEMSLEDFETSLNNKEKGGFRNFGKITERTYYELKKEFKIFIIKQQLKNQ